MCRVLGAECYELAEKFRKRDKKLSLQYMKLAAKLLGLSLRPKKLDDLEQIKKALAELKGLERAPGIG
jgi:NTP pyrophosphatase (non-canonical NTP hydrolase)